MRCEALKEVHEECHATSSEWWSPATLLKIRTFARLLKELISSVAKRQNRLCREAAAAPSVSVPKRNLDIVLKKTLWLVRPAVARRWGRPCGYPRRQRLCPPALPCPALPALRAPASRTPHLFQCIPPGSLCHRSRADVSLSPQRAPAAAAGRIF